MMDFFKNLSFGLKLSLVVFVILLVWILSGLIFNKKETEQNSFFGGGKMVFLADEIKQTEVYKTVEGYGKIDRGRIDVISELNSHVERVFKSEGLAVYKGEPVLELLSGVRIPAPISGILDRIEVNVGDIVFGGQSLLFSVISNSKMEAIINIPVTDARFLTVGNTVEITVENLIFTGKVYFISKISDKTTNTFEVKIKIDQPKQKAELFHDETVKIAINASKKMGFFVPTSALSVGKNDETQVTVITKEKIAKKVTVEILQVRDNGVWVSGDVGEAKIVIIRGGDFSNEGEKVEYKLK